MQIKKQAGGVGRKGESVSPRLFPPHSFIRFSHSQSSLCSNLLIGMSSARSLIIRSDQTTHLTTLVSRGVAVAPEVVAS